MSCAACFLALTLAQTPTEAPSIAEEPTSEPSDAGLALGFTMTSIFNDRGTNLLSTRGQNEHQLAVVPRVELSFRETGVYAGYFGVLKLAGRDPDVGTNAFSVFRVGMRRQLTDELSLDGSMGLVLLPMVRDAETPWALEPTIKATWNGPVSVSLAALYSYSVPETYAPNRYAYFNPSVSRSFVLSDELSLQAGATLGYKAYTQDQANPRPWDASAQAGLSWTSGDLRVTPALNLAWVEISEAAVEDEVMAWASVDFGFGLGL